MQNLRCSTISKFQTRLENYNENVDIIKVMDNIGENINITTEVCQSPYKLKQ
jgi:hypothetical protein